MTILIIIVLSIITILLLAIIIFAFFFARDLFRELPYVATKKERINTIIKLANIEKGQTVIDLGSGDGRLLFAAARKGAYAIGYEINPLLVALTRIKFFFVSLRSRAKPASQAKRGERGRSNLKNEIATSSKTRLAMTGSVIVHRQNLWQADLSQADVIFVYGLAKTMQKFQDFVYQNAQKGTRIVVNTNPFPSKKSQREENNIFLYIR